MPRNGSGTYSVVNSFSSGTTISSSEMNANFTDIASEITNSLPRDGQAAMTGTLKIPAGSSSAPSLTFSVDTNTGLYRFAADTIGFAAAGTLVARMSSAGFSKSTGESFDAFEAGTAMVFYQASAPTGWTAESINDRALRVVSSGGTGGSTGGTTAFSSVLTSRTIAQANLPNVNLTAASNGAHTHVMFYDASTTGSTRINAGQYAFAEVDDSSSSRNYRMIGTANTPDTGITGSNGAHTHTVPLGGSGTAMDFAVQYADVIVATKD